MQTTQYQLLDPDAVMRDIFKQMRELDLQEHSCLNEILTQIQDQRRANEISLSPKNK